MNPGAISKSKHTPRPYPISPPRFLPSSFNCFKIQNGRKRAEGPTAQSTNYEGRTAYILRIIFGCGSAAPGGFVSIRGSLKSRNCSISTSESIFLSPFSCPILITILSCLPAFLIHPPFVYFVAPSKRHGILLSPKG